MDGLSAGLQHSRGSLEPKALESPKIYKYCNNCDILIDIQLSISIYDDNIFGIQLLACDLVRDGP